MVVSETPSDSAPAPTILVCVKQVNLLSTLECDEAPKHFTGHDNQLSSLSGGIHGLKDFLPSIKGLKNIVTSEKIPQTMNSWQ